MRESELEQVERARGYHELAINEILVQDFAYVIHPLGALSIAHTILLMPVSDSSAKEALDTAHGILEKRFNALPTAEEAFKEYNGIRQYQILHSSGADYTLGIHKNIWPVAFTMLEQPVEQSELQAYEDAQDHDISEMSIRRLWAGSELVKHRPMPKLGAGVGAMQEWIQKASKRQQKAEKRYSRKLDRD